MNDLHVTRLAHFLSELVGTTLIIFIALSAAAVFFGMDPVREAIPSTPLRAFLATAVFCCSFIAMLKSPFGKISGSHLNPAVSLAFALEGLLPWRELLVYIPAQILGAICGCYLIGVVWGGAAEQVHFGLTTPMAGLTLLEVAAIEAALTCGVLSLAFYFMHHERIHPYCPYVVAVYFVVVKLLAASFTGAGMNPARSLAPAIIAGDYRTVSAYVIGPLVGAAAAHLIHRLCGLKRPKFHKFGHAAHGEHYLMNLLGRPYHYVHDLHLAHFPHIQHRHREQTKAQTPT